MNTSQQRWIQKLLNEFSHALVVQFGWNHIVIHTPVFGVCQVDRGGEFGIVWHWRVEIEVVIVVVGIHDVGGVRRGESRELVVENGFDILDMSE